MYILKSVYKNYNFTKDDIQQSAILSNLGVVILYWTMDFPNKDNWLKSLSSKFINEKSTMSKIKIFPQILNDINLHIITACYILYRNKKLLLKTPSRNSIYFMILTNTYQLLLIEFYYLSLYNDSQKLTNDIIKDIKKKKIDELIKNTVFINKLNNLQNIYSRGIGHKEHNFLYMKHRRIFEEKLRKNNNVFKDIVDILNPDNNIDLCLLERLKNDDNNHFLKAIEYSSGFFPYSFLRQKYDKSINTHVISMTLFSIIVNPGISLLSYKSIGKLLRITSIPFPKS